ncbi:MAG: bifunctional phosphopantothenoylcysteine decarboxylase/phosphopantothenate--cysteine ligase CoaBC [Gammaproteobacteria bacterium]|nr:bifunctional phosphopantothenoylcysteine decarboxylase/phosphopantothenate--cysteine ligase CoaBC [Gammaproteobacteria bacterium]
MNNTAAKNQIVLGVTGGIAAYKSADLVRRLREKGADVRVVMTRSAQEFITPMTLQAVSGNPVRTSLWDAEAEAAMGHIELARWADTVLVAPATAEFMAQLAHGLAGDLLTTLCLATEAQVVLAPAMNHQMWANPATQTNREILESRGIAMLGPAEGDQACGEIGPGRMLEPRDIADWLFAAESEQLLAGMRVLMTAGPTREPVDPVRYISNRSSGKMGFAIAGALRAAGARVTVVSGPVSLPTPAGVERVDVDTAAEMYDAVIARLDGTHIYIGTAAVADYAPDKPAVTKIKKHSGSMELSLSRTRDILAAVALDDRDIFTVGFAAETNDLEKHARAKMKSKQLDMVAANWVGDGRGFEQDDNALSVYWQGGSTEIENASKDVVARQLVSLIALHYSNKTNNG